MAVTKFERDVVAVLKNKKYTGNIKFTLLGRKVAPEMFQRVADAIASDKIQVRWVDKKSKIPGDGQYDHKKNTFYVRDTTADIGDRNTLLVHEAVHAYSDILGIARDPWPEEAIAFVAGSACLYNMGLAKDPILHDFAMLGIGGKTKHKLADLLNALKQYLQGVGGGHAYNLKDKYQFDGVPGAKK